MNNCIWIGIGTDIEKNTELYKNCLKANNFLLKYKNFYKFSNTTKPHLNLYDLDIPFDKVEVTLASIEKLLKNSKVLEIKINNIGFFKFGLFFAGVEPSQELFELHKKIVEPISKFKENCLCKDYLQPSRNYNFEQKRMLSEYGNPYVLNQFQPHITLGHIKNLNLPNILDRMERLWSPQSYLLDKIQIIIQENNKYRLAKTILLKN